MLLLPLENSLSENLKVLRTLIKAYLQRQTEGFGAPNEYNRSDCARPQNDNSLRVIIFGAQVNRPRAGVLYLFHPISIWCLSVQALIARKLSNISHLQALTFIWGPRSRNIGAEIVGNFIRALIAVIWDVVFVVKVTSISFYWFCIKWLSPLIKTYHSKLIPRSATMRHSH